MAGWPMTRRRLASLLDVARVEQAIRRAERRTSGEIRVSLAGLFRGDLRSFGARAFERLGMTATRHRNGVLILLAPWRRQFLVLGDEGVHAEVGDALWSTLAQGLAERFRAGDFTGGLVLAIERVGAALAAHFPPEPDDLNELSDELDVGAETPGAQR